MYNKIQFGMKGFASNQETLSCVIPINYYKQNKCIVFNWLNFGFRRASQSMNIEWWLHNKIQWRGYTSFQETLS